VFEVLPPEVVNPRTRAGVGEGEIGEVKGSLREPQEMEESKEDGVGMVNLL
jgi:hypothetical protein